MQPALHQRPTQQRDTTVGKTVERHQMRRMRGSLVGEAPTGGDAPAERGEIGLPRRHVPADEFAVEDRAGRKPRLKVRGDVREVARQVTLVTRLNQDSAAGQPPGHRAPTVLLRSWVVS